MHGPMTNGRPMFSLKQGWRIEEGSAGTQTSIEGHGGTCEEQLEGATTTTYSYLKPIQHNGFRLCTTSSSIFMFFNKRNIF